MAVKKKATKRKTGAKKRKARVGASPATIIINGKRYTKKVCGLTKLDAQKKAKAHREKGANKFAVTRKNKVGAGYCMFARG